LRFFKFDQSMLLGPLSERALLLCSFTQRALFDYDNPFFSSFAIAVVAI
jgi:hypothetical protein